MVMVIFGLGLVGLGITLFMDRGLIALGNGIFLFGLICISGPKKMYYAIRSRDSISWKELICLVLGIVLVFSKYPIFGLILQSLVFIMLIGRSRAIIVLRRIKSMLLSF